MADDQDLIFQTMGTKEKDILYLLIRVSEALSKSADKFFKKYGITEAQYRILDLLERSSKKGLTQVEISRKLSVNRSNITGLIDRLERDGFVSRSSETGDRRVNQIRLKEKSKNILLEMNAPFLEWISVQMKNSSREEMKIFSYILEKIEKNLTAGN
jgi:DNA-binding MarR family transcriptional regulator